MIQNQWISCPYCGESFEIPIDYSGGSQEMIEDCEVCCQPITLDIRVDLNGELNGVITKTDND